MKKITLLFLAPFLVPILLHASHRPPVAFVENTGQVHMTGEQQLQVYFVLQAKELTYFFSERGYSIVKRDSAWTSRVDVFFEDNVRCVPEGKNLLAGRTQFILPGEKITANSYAAIVYHDAVKNCELEFSMNGDFLQRKLTARIGALPSSFDFIVAGASLHAGTGPGFDFITKAGTISERVVSESGVETTLQGGYRLRPDEAANASSITWMTYVGGTSADEFFATALTPDEGAIVAGRTNSTDFPATAGSMQDTLSGSYDAVIMRFDATGNCLWSTFYGGTNFETAYALLYTGSRIIVGGGTNSTDLPVLNAFQDSCSGGYDVFLLTLNDSGMMVRATYYGASGGDQAFALALDTVGRIAVAGSSTGPGLPMTAGSYQPSPAGAIDAFLAVFDTLLMPQWATYYGGTSSEDIHSVTVTPQGEIVFCGGTYSANFPVTPDAWQPGMLGMPDVYIVKFGMDGTRHYSTFFGGTNTEDANGVVADSLGKIYVTGFTYSVDFPIQGNSFQNLHAALSDTYVSCFDPNGQLTWSTFVGGNGVETAFGIFRQGKYLYIGGNTESTDFPVSANAFQPAYAGNSDGFVFKMDTTGDMISGTYVGGNGVDAIYSLVVTPSDTSVIACADTYSTDLPVTPGAYQSVNNGSGDGFVVKFGMSEQPAPNGTGPAIVPGNSTLLLYPNPTSAAVKINAEGVLITRVEIFNVNGVLVQALNGAQSEMTIDVSGLAKGVYLLRVYSGMDGVQVVRLVKQ